jgi:hypothetical protein
VKIKFRCIRRLIVRKNKSAFIFLLAALVLAVASMGLGKTPRAHAQAAYGITPTAEPAPTEPPPTAPPPTDTPPAPTAPPATAAPGATSAPEQPEATPAVLPESGGAFAPNWPLVLLAGLALVMSGLLAFKPSPVKNNE